MKSKTLMELREQIDAIDEEILECIGKRMNLIERVGEVKKAENKAIQDEKREQIVLNHAEKVLGTGGREIYETILRVSREKQKEIVNQ